jgi:hypothetical protein
MSMTLDQLKPKTEIVEYLTSEEEKELDRYEEEVITLSSNVLESAKRVGEILSIIKDKKLFSKARRNKDTETYSDFAHYAKVRFGRGKTMAYNYVSIFNVMKTMEEEGFDPMMLGSIQNTLQVHHELKRLTKANQDLNPLFREILKKGITLIENISPVDEAGNIDLSPEGVTAAFKTIEEIAVTGAYTIDDRQIPMTLANIAVNDQASREMFELVQQRRLLISEDSREKRNKRFQPKSEPKTITLPTNIEIKEVYVMCPIHGMTSGEALLQGGFRMRCECRAIIRTEIGKETIFMWFDKEK